MALRMIKPFDEEVLRKKSRPVEEVDDRIQQLLNDMVDTLRNTPNGGGLAACQVGVLKRVVIANLGEGLVKLINPVIVEQEGEQVVIEGCLSYPGIWGKVRRPFRVSVKASDENGQPVTIRAAGEMAKCLCHEIDHLDGIVFTDKVIEYISTGNNNRNSPGTSRRGVSG